MDEDRPQDRGGHGKGSTWTRSMVEQVEADEAAIFCGSSPRSQHVVNRRTPRVKDVVSEEAPEVEPVDTVRELQQNQRFQLAR